MSGAWDFWKGPGGAGRQLEDCGLWVEGKSAEWESGDLVVGLALSTCQILVKCVTTGLFSPSLVQWNCLGRHLRSCSLNDLPQSPWGVTFPTLFTKTACGIRLKNINICSVAYMVIEVLPEISCAFEIFNNNKLSYYLQMPADWFIVIPASMTLIKMGKAGKMAFSGPPGVWQLLNSCWDFASTPYSTCFQVLQPSGASLPQGLVFPGLQSHCGTDLRLWRPDVI